MSSPTGPHAARLGTCLVIALGLSLVCSFAPGRGPAELEAGSCVGNVRLHGLGFARDGVEVPPDDAIVLDAVAPIIRESCAGRTVVIEGHTDVSGLARVQPAPLRTARRCGETPPRGARRPRRAAPHRGPGREPPGHHRSLPRGSGAEPPDHTARGAAALSRETRTLDFGDVPPGSELRGHPSPPDRAIRSRPVPALPAHDRSSTRIRSIAAGSRTA